MKALLGARPKVMASLASPKGRYWALELALFTLSDLLDLFTLLTVISTAAVLEFILQSRHVLFTVQLYYNIYITASHSLALTSSLFLSLSWLGS